MMVYSIRDSRWRAIFWRGRNGPSILATELYDERNYPDTRFRWLYASGTASDSYIKC